MISLEIGRVVRTSERDQVRTLMEERPSLSSLQIGYHFRNEAEALDVLDLINAQVPSRMYVGLAGGRQAGKIYHSEEKIGRKFRNDIPTKLIRRIADEWPEVGSLADGRKPLELPGLKNFTVSIRPANAFFYDIDVVVVPREFAAESILHPDVGSRSGTKIDLFIVSQQKLLHHDHPFYPSVFFNSQRLPYPFERTRERIDFRRVFRGWRASGQRSREALAAIAS